MVPNTIDCERDTRGSPHSPSSSPKHRRGKTGKIRKKRRYWGLFSRWKTSESEDDDDFELYQWSKSRGLTARALPSQTTAQPTANTLKTNRMRYNDYTDLKSTVVQRNSGTKNNVKHAVSANAVASLQEAVFLTKLCPCIRDKRSFVDESKHNDHIETRKAMKLLSNDITAVASPQKQTQQSVHQAEAESDNCEFKNGSKMMEAHKSASDVAEIENPLTKMTEDIKIDKKREEASSEMQNETSHSGKSSSSTTVSTSTTMPPPTIPMIKKEWSASVESDILRLYESTSTIRTSTNLVYSWANPTSATAPPMQLSSIPKTVEQKIEQAEYTPSYVQMLAKMFKNRVQMRKDRDDRVEENLKRSKITLDCVGNRSLSPKSDFVLPKTTSYPIVNPHPISKAHLRYRHLVDRRSAARPNEETNQMQLEMSHTIRIDQLEVGYTHGRYSKALKYNSENNFVKLPNANGNSPSTHKTGGLVVDYSSMEGQTENEEKNAGTDREILKLYTRHDLSTKLRKPTPHYTTFKHIGKQDSRSALILAKKARRNMTKLKPNEIVDGTSGGKPEVVETSETPVMSEYSSAAVRWSTSVGSLYCRPSSRILTKPTAQKA